MGGAPDPPEAPNPYATSAAQSAANRDTAVTTALLNYVNEETPYGSLTYENTGYWMLPSSIDAEGNSIASGGIPRLVQYGQGGAPSGPPAFTPAAAVAPVRQFDERAYEDAIRTWQKGEHRGMQGPRPSRTDEQFWTTGSGGPSGGGGGGGYSVPAGGGVPPGYYTIPQFTRRTTLSPSQQILFDLENQLKTQLLEFGNDQTALLRDHLSEPVSFDDAPIIDADGTLESRRRVEEALLSRLNPELDRQRELLEARLASSGVLRGTEAYDREVDELNRMRIDANNQAIMLGGQEESRMFGQQLSNRQQSINEILALRNQPINEIGAILGLTQVQAPQFAPPPTIPVQGTDLEGNVYRSYQGELDAYNQAQARRGSTLGSIFGGASSLLGGIIGLSDRRFKKNIKPIARLASGLRLYAFDYIMGGARRIGYMADEIRRVSPEAVINSNGIDYVDYAAVRV